ncbi:MAG TPA: ribosome biogenesis GTPase Der [Firmicutes bacterium]|nr:ribosome biogenesis GTPase Der [Candidatus Fermentithermobacillaceae bacterium]
MPDKFTVAIVGRPNVGKSSLFNRMVQDVSSIVHKVSGVTRDRLYGTCRWGGQEFTLLDTGGLDLSSTDDMVQAIRVQVERAIEEADLLLFVVDVRAGLTPEDVEVAEILRRTKKPLLLVANKADSAGAESKAVEFYALGFGEVYPVSAAHGLGVGDVLDRILELRGEPSEVASTREAEEGAPIRVAIVGKPNVGKSSLVNALLGVERMTVSSRAGTTVDAVDTPLRYEDTDYVLVDTAGLRRPKLIEEKLEGLSVSRALSAVKRADVAILVVDGTEAPSSQERRIAGYILRNAKASVIVVNKTDLGFTDGVAANQYKAAVLQQCRPIGYSPVIFISCKTGKGIDKVLPEVKKVYEEYSKRIPTPVLNQFIAEVTELNRPPQGGRVYYATQVGERPPHMVFFVKDPTQLTGMYQRYLDSEFRKRFGFSGSPIVMEFKERQRRKLR